MPDKPTYEELLQRTKALEAALQNSETQLNPLTDASFEALFLSEKGICLDQNIAAERLFSYTRIEAVGRYGVEWIAVKDRELVKNRILSDYEKAYEVNALRKDGTTFPCEIQARTLNCQGRSFRITALRDITDRKRDEEALRESEKRFMDVLQASDNAILLIANEAFVDFNDATVRLLGYAGRDKLLMKHPSELSPPIQPDGRSSFEKAEEMIQTALEKGSNRFEWIHRKASGEDFPVEVTLTPITFKGKNVLHCHWKDLTDQKRMEEEIETNAFYLQTIMDNSEEGFCFLNTDAVIIKINRAMSDILKRSREEILGQSYYKFMDRHWRRKARANLEMRRKGLSSTYEVIFTRPDGSKVPCRVHGNPIFDKKGVITGTFGLIADHSDIKQVQKKLEIAIVKANEANRAKSDFVANMNHEIRTPMNAILGFTDILEEQINDQEHRQYLSLIRSSGKSLLTLINDILDLSKIEAGKMRFEYEPIKPVSVFKEIIGLFFQKAEVKGLKLVLETEDNLSEYLLLDEVRLRQILLNLVGNAVKFTESGFIKISVKTLVHDETSDTLDFIFSVEDTGIGISEDQKKNIFKAFEQQSGQDHATYGGTGLGLAITKRLVEMMGGAISVSGEKGRGSVFTVTLQNVRKVESSAQNVRKVESSAILKKGNDMSADSVIFDKATILIADDVRSNRMLLIANLKKCGFEFIEAENGRQAVDLAQAYHPDLILMDMKMPVMDGREATVILKAGDATKGIPVIAVTAAAMKDSAREISILCDGYLKKPVKKTDMITELTRFLKHSPGKPISGGVTQTLSDESEYASYTPASETLKKLPELIRMLETGFIPRWEKISDIMIMDHVMQFARDLNRIDREFGFLPLTAYSERLMGCTRSYDVVSVKKKVAEFPDFINQAKQLSENN